MGRELNTKRSSLPGKINEKYAFIHTKLKLDHFHFNSLPFGHLLSLSLNSPRTFLHQECGIIYCIGNQDLAKTFFAPGHCQYPTLNCTKKREDEEFVNLSI